MNQAPRAAWRTVLAITIAVGAGYAWADDVFTVRPAWSGELAFPAVCADGWSVAPPSLPFAPLEPHVVLATRLLGGKRR